MEQIICALAGMALGGGLLALGFALGKLDGAGDRAAWERTEAPQAGAARWEAAPREETEGETSPREKALERLEADQRAFSALMGYSADVAYGLSRHALTEE